MILHDKIEEYKGAIIQHGPYNDRIYLMKVVSPSKELAHELISLAKLKKYSKIFAKVPENMSKSFLDAGFSVEAKIPSFFFGKESAFFLGFYTNKKRYEEKNVSKIDEVLSIALKQKEISPNNDDHYLLRKCTEKDIHSMANIYKKVFSSYPFPIFDPDYLLKTMKSHVDYFAIEAENGLVAVSSAEIDHKALNAEMTDFAVIPEWRGHNFAFKLLVKMENEVKRKGIKTTYTIARAISHGINITFARAGYKFAGRLRNNTNIAGQIESMNVWYKNL